MSSKTALHKYMLVGYYKENCKPFYYVTLRSMDLPPKSKMLLTGTMKACTKRKNQLIHLERFQ